jgi:hypothetical protein
MLWMKELKMVEVMRSLIVRLLKWTEGDPCTIENINPGLD